MAARDHVVFCVLALKSTCEILEEEGPRNSNKVSKSLIDCTHCPFSVAIQCHPMPSTYLFFKIRK